jgi:hypothetical protein
MNNVCQPGAVIPPDSNVAALAEAVQKCGTGDQASLRRMVPASPPLVFYRLLLQHIPDAWSGPEQERAWAAVMQGMALLSLSLSKSESVHDQTRSLGQVLWQTLSESG